MCDFRIGYIFTDVLELIQSMESEDYRGPEHYKEMNKAEFDYQSYKRWALSEVRVYILKNSVSGRQISCFEAVEEFRNLMDDYACQSKTLDCNFIFAVAYDVATDLLDRMISH